MATQMRSLATQMDVRPVSRVLKAVADESRLRIVALLSHGELCVCDIESALGLSQPNASRQLGLLRSAGVVEPRRDGNWIYYRLAPQTHEACKQLLRTLVKSFADQGQLRKDIARLLKARGPGACR